MQDSGFGGSAGTSEEMESREERVGEDEGGSKGHSSEDTVEASQCGRQVWKEDGELHESMGDEVDGGGSRDELPFVQYGWSVHHPLAPLPWLGHLNQGFTSQYSDKSLFTHHPPYQPHIYPQHSDSLSYFGA